MFECFHCLCRSLVWQNDYDASDFGYDWEGIVQILRCANCGAEVEYRVPNNPEEFGELQKVEEHDEQDGVD